jgi:hypothetical protein
VWIADLGVAETSNIITTSQPARNRQQHRLNPRCALDGRYAGEAEALVQRQGRIEWYTTAGPVLQRYLRNARGAPALAWPFNLDFPLRPES